MKISAPGYQELVALGKRFDPLLNLIVVAWMNSLNTVYPRICQLFQFFIRIKLARVRDDHGPPGLFYRIYDFVMGIVLVIDVAQPLITDMPNKRFFESSDISFFQENSGDMRAAYIPTVRFRFHFFNVYFESFFGKLFNNPLCPFQARMIMSAGEFQHGGVVGIKTVGEQMTFPAVYIRSDLNTGQ